MELNRGLRDALRWAAGHDVPGQAVRGKNISRLVEMGLLKEMGPNGEVRLTPEGQAVLRQVGSALKTA